MYSYWRSIKKALVRGLLIAIPIALQAFPEQWLNLTLGGVLIFILDWLKHRVNLSIVKNL